jgi:RNA polymerase sigma factor (sigma-70 family)
VNDALSFRELVQRVRERDQDAAAELVRRYEPAIRVAVRVRLTDPLLRRLLDSVDICQSVLGDFFVHIADGRFELERPEQLVALLATMARNKVTNQALRQRAARRDQRRVAPGGLDPEVADPGPDPSDLAEQRDLCLFVQDHLPPAEREIARLRGEGYEWAEIAEAVGATPDAVRVRLNRALGRLAGAPDAV